LAVGEGGFDNKKEQRMNSLDKWHLELSTELDELEAAIAATTAEKAIMMIARKVAIEEVHQRLSRVRTEMNNKPALGERSEPPTDVLGDVPTTESAMAVLSKLQPTIREAHRAELIDAFFDGANYVLCVAVKNALQSISLKEATEAWAKKRGYIA